MIYVRQGNPFAERRHAAIPCQRRVFWCPNSPAKAEASTYGQFNSVGWAILQLTYTLTSSSIATGIESR